MSKEIEEILNKYIYCSVDDKYKVSEKGIKLAFNTQQQKIEQLEKEVERLESIHRINSYDIVILEKENTKLKERVKELSKSFFCNDECIDIAMERETIKKCKIQCEKCK